VPKQDQINLLELLHLTRNSNLIESKTAYFNQNVPSIAPEAYLHTIFKPLPAPVVSALPHFRELPAIWKDFFAIQNGADLFSGAISLYGLHPHGQMLSRKGGLDSRLPFDLANESSNRPPPNPKENLKIGGYGFDGSLVCLNRKDESISVFRRDGSELIALWHSPTSWLTNEIARIGMLFDSSGNRLGDEIETRPIKHDRVH
jgi:hypothetical protein